MDELKECPFCGKKGSLLVGSDEIGWVYVYCAQSDNGCGASGPSAVTREEAVKMWNRRA